MLGTAKLDDLDDVIAATDIEMESEDLDYLAETYRPRPVFGRGWALIGQAAMTA